ncbi:hypothetical protein [Rouxiella chamberiensis]|uniref:Serine protease n=1 Tax=Rouxiella chamberiensis TaxID=1513468 RepID=A0ABY7HQJ6_9GAMM|nr:hypothetical protein [Rouxiella chamberiensis]WAT01508.1 hypothetical protein O1V66_01610 [Rouxiella chamberiensis]
MENVNGLSLTTTMILLKSGGNVVSQGTGFFYFNRENITFLATNFHVVTGLDPVDKGNKEPKGDELEIFLRDKSGKPVSKVIPLYKDGEKLWLEHPTDTLADLVLIPMLTGHLDNIEYTSINSTFVSSEIRLTPSTSVVMIGYPHGYHDEKIDYQFGKLEVLQVNLIMTSMGKK